MRTVVVRHESWPLRAAFTIARGSRTEAEVVVAEVREGAAVGRGECVPYPRYGESVPGVVAQIKRVSEAVVRGATKADLEGLLPPGAARNALDCALWDLEAKRTGVPVWRLAGLAQPGPMTTAFTVSLDTPDAMAGAAADAAEYPLLKLKLGGAGDDDRVAAVREAAPRARLIVDANESWSEAELPDLLRAMARFGVELVEQPLPAGLDDALAGLPHPVPVCADEACHVAADVPSLANRYDAVNVKLDKAGGLSEALRVLAAARAHELEIMVGTMLGTSLLMAPATLLAGQARWVDLDGPLWMAQDHPSPLLCSAGRLYPPEAALWG